MKLLMLSRDSRTSRKPRVKKIGIVLPNWIGDVVMATPTLRALRQHYGAEAEFVGIMRPYVSNVLDGTRCRVDTKQDFTMGLRQDLMKGDFH